MNPTTIKKGKGAVVVSSTEFKGVKYIDVRNFYDAAGELKPTPKGLMIPIDNAQAVADAIQKHLGALKSGASEIPKVYVSVPERLVVKLKSVTKSFKAPETRVYEGLKEAKSGSKKEGTVIVSITGQFEIEDTNYLFEDGSKCRELYTFSDGTWIKS